MSTQTKVEVKKCEGCETKEPVEGDIYCQECIDTQDDYDDYYKRKYDTPGLCTECGCDLDSFAGSLCQMCADEYCPYSSDDDY